MRSQKRAYVFVILCSLILCLQWFNCSPQNNTESPNQESITEVPSHEHSTESHTSQEPQHTDRENLGAVDSGNDEHKGHTEHTTAPDEPSSQPDITPEPIQESPPGESSLKTCTFNADCPTSERCECKESTGCFCKQGTRGTGKNGVDTCKTGEDCETALCNEGNGGVYYCSGPCTKDSDCGPNLPICAKIAFLGQVCIRKRQ